MTTSSKPDWLREIARRARERKATKDGVVRALRDGIANMKAEPSRLTRSDRVHILLGWLLGYGDDALRKEVGEWLDSRPAPGPVSNNPTRGGDL